MLEAHVPQDAHRLDTGGRSDGMGCAFAPDVQIIHTLHDMVQQLEMRLMEVSTQATKARAETVTLRVLNQAAADKIQWLQEQLRDTSLKLEGKEIELLANTKLSCDIKDHVASLQEELIAFKKPYQKSQGQIQCGGWGIEKLEDANVWEQLGGGLVKLFSPRKQQSIVVSSRRRANLLDMDSDDCVASKTSSLSQASSEEIFSRDDAMTAQPPKPLNKRRCEGSAIIEPGAEPCTHLSTPCSKGGRREGKEEEEEEKQEDANLALLKQTRAELDLVQEELMMRMQHETRPAENRTSSPVRSPSNGQKSFTSCSSSSTPVNSPVRPYRTRTMTMERQGVAMNGGRFMVGYEIGESGDDMVTPLPAHSPACASNLHEGSLKEGALQARDGFVIATTRRGSAITEQGAELCTPLFPTPCSKGVRREEEGGDANLALLKQTRAELDLVQAELVMRMQHETRPAGNRTPSPVRSPRTPKSPRRETNLTPNPDRKKGFD
jgi:hypothetical protein